MFGYPLIQPFALGLCLSSTLGIFVIEIVSMSYGARRRTKAEG